MSHPVESYSGWSFESGYCPLTYSAFGKCTMECLSSYLWLLSTIPFQSFICTPQLKGKCVVPRFLVIVNEVTGYSYMFPHVNVPPLFWLKTCKQHG